MRTPSISHALALALALASFVALGSTAGCGQRACRDGTLFLSIDYRNGAEAADTLELSLSVGGAAPLVRTVQHRPSETSGTLEAEIAGGYPANQSLVLTVRALAGGTLLATEERTFTASAGCSTLPITLDGSGATALDLSDPSSNSDGGGGGGGGGGDGGGVTGDMAVPDVVITPTTVSLKQTRLQRFTANQPVTWQVVEGNGGQIDSDGRYAAPAQDGTYHVRATSVADNTKTAMATITVSGTVSLQLLAGPLGGRGTLDGTGDNARFVSTYSAVAISSTKYWVSDIVACTIREVDTTTRNVRTVVGVPFDCQTVNGDAGTVGRISVVVSMAVISTSPLRVAIGQIDAIRIYDGSTNSLSTAASNVMGLNSMAVVGNLLYFGEQCALRELNLTNSAVNTRAGNNNLSMCGDMNGTGTSAQFGPLVSLVYDAAGSQLIAFDGQYAKLKAIRVSDFAVTTPFPAIPNLGAMYPAIDSGRNLYYSKEPSALYRLHLSDNSTSLVAGDAQSGFIDGTIASARFSEIYGVVPIGSGSQQLICDSSVDFGGFPTQTAYAWGTVRLIDYGTNSVSHVAGLPERSGRLDGPPTEALFSVPGAIADDGAGALYVADTGNVVIRKVVLSTGVVSTVAGMVGTSGSADGVGPAATFTTLTGLAVVDGVLYIADGNLRKMPLATKAVETPATTLPALGVAAGPAGTLYFTSQHSVRALDTATGGSQLIAGQATSGSTDGMGASASFNGPAGLAYDPRGFLFVADLGNATIRQIDLSTKQVTTIAGTALSPGAVDGDRASARLRSPRGLALDGRGGLYVGEQTRASINLNAWEKNRAIRRVTIQTGEVTSVVGQLGSMGVRTGALPGSLSAPSGIATLANGDLVISDRGEHSLLIVR